MFKTVASLVIHITGFRPSNETLYDVLVPIANVSREGSDKPVHTQSLRAFVSRKMSKYGGRGKLLLKFRSRASLGVELLPC